jgi:hypothetical protein
MEESGERGNRKKGEFLELSNLGKQCGEIGAP